MARASDTAGPLGRTVEDHLVTEVRAFSDIHQTSEFRRKLSTWLTARGGFGGIGSGPKMVATPSDHQGGWKILP
eukprot:3844133-Pyramimonas_sp.AAC.1